MYSKKYVSKKTNKRENDSHFKPPIFAGCFIFMVQKGVIEDDYRFYQLEILQRGGTIQKQVDERTTHVVAVTLTCAFEEIFYVEVRRFPFFCLRMSF